MSADASGTWILFGDRGGVAAALKDGLRRQGASVLSVEHGPKTCRIAADSFQLDPADREGFDDIVAGALAMATPLRGLVHLFSLDIDGAAEIPSHRLGCESALFVVQALARLAWRPAPELFLITRGAQPAVTPVSEASLWQAPLWGFGRVLSNERSDVQSRLIDLDPGSPPGEADALLQEILRPRGEEQIALRAEGRYVARLSRGTLPVVGGALSFRDTTLITGGLGALGLALARALVRRGAKHLVLVSRHPPAPAARAVLDELSSALGARIIAPCADVADRAALAGVLRRIDSEMPPLRAVFHAAGVLDDAMLEQQTPARFAAVMGPKALGAWNLHTLTRERGLDHFVLYSSLVSLLGLPGQANYAAANAFVDALAHARRAAGLAGLSINWAPFTGVGLAASADRAERLVGRGIGSLTLDAGTELLFPLLTSDAAQVGVMEFDPRHWLEFLPRKKSSSTLAALIARVNGQANGSTSERVDLLRDFALLGEQEQRVRAEGLVREQLGRVLRQKPEHIHRDAPFPSVGLDSLTSLELRNRLERATGVNLPATALFSHPTVGELAEFIGGLLVERRDGGSGHDPVVIPKRHVPRARHDFETNAKAEGAVPLLTDEQALVAIEAEIARLEGPR